MKCFHCYKILDSEDEAPYGATLFQAFGNYGSTFYDPEVNIMNENPQECLVIYICDTCLTKSSEFIEKWNKHHEKN
jgi:hypothetical protein